MHCWMFTYNWIIVWKAIPTACCMNNAYWSCRCTYITVFKSDRGRAFFHDLPPRPPPPDVKKVRVFGQLGSTKIWEVFLSKLFIETVYFLTLCLILTRRENIWKNEPIVLKKLSIRKRTKMINIARFNRTSWPTT